MFAESHPIIRQTLRFCALPYCYLKLVNWKQCPLPKIQVAFDLLSIFFKFKYFPDNYSPCRFWELDKAEWVYYYGSSYHSYQRKKLRKEVQTYERMIIFDDKSVCEQLCTGIGVQMPSSFGTIEPHTEYKKKLRFIFKKHKLQKIIIKPILGHAGRGILLVQKSDNFIKVNDGLVWTSLENFQLNTKAVVQEVISQHSEISKMSKNSVNTIRVLTLYTKTEEVIIVSSSMRFGVGEAFVDNWSAGGVAVGVDHNQGRLKEIAYDKFGNQYTIHPTSGITFKNFKIPYWDQILDMATKVQRFCYFYKLIGMDIALSQNGPVLIEVNANPDLVFQEQTSGPLLKDNRVLKEFDSYGLLINKYQKQLTAQL